MILLSSCGFGLTCQLSFNCIIQRRRGEMASFRNPSLLRQVLASSSFSYCLSAVENVASRNACVPFMCSVFHVRKTGHNASHLKTWINLIIEFVQRKCGQICKWCPGNVEKREYSKTFRSYPRVNTFRNWIFPVFFVICVNNIQVFQRKIALALDFHNFYCTALVWCFFCDLQWQWIQIN